MTHPVSTSIPDNVILHVDSALCVALIKTSWKEKKTGYWFTMAWNRQRRRLIHMGTSYVRVVIE